MATPHFEAPSLGLDRSMTEPMPAKRIRAPKFIEVFDATFSEELVNDPRYPNPANTPGLGSATLSRPKLSISSRQTSSTSTASQRTRQRSQPTSPSLLSPHTWDNDSKRRSVMVNERIRDWARRSFISIRASSALTDDNLDAFTSPKFKSGSVGSDNFGHGLDVSGPYTNNTRYSQSAVAVRDMSE